MITAPGRLADVAHNALEVARFGGFETDEEASPYEVVATRPVYRLRHYFPAAPRTRAGRPAVLLVPPLMLAADIYDVAPTTSAVAILAEEGIDPWVIDFGAPEHEEGGLERSLTDHVLAVDEAIDLVREQTGHAAIHISGYSQGGMFCYQVAAFRRSAGIDSIIAFGSPVDTRGTLTFGLPEDVAIAVAEFLTDHVFAGSGVPAWLSRNGFRLLDPVKSLHQRLEFIRQLHDREALLSRERQRRFIEAEGWVAWPGPALADVIRQFGVHNRLVSGGFTIEDRLVTLADMTNPVLAFVGASDEIAPARSVRAARWAAPRSDVYEVDLPAGHFGLVVGSVAVQRTWPTVAAWIHWRAGTAEMPDGVEPIVEGEEGLEDGGGDRLRAGTQLALGAGIGTVQALAGAALGATRTLREIVGESAGPLDQLNRLGRVNPRTRISLGLLLDERVEEEPDDIVLLFGDRGHTYAAVQERVDNVVRGLLEIGVRQGEHVGVLMQTRPSALTIVAALNRLGAVAVLMRPDGDPAREAGLGRARRIVADPQNGEAAAAATGLQVYVLGGGGGKRELAHGLVDMERIDPDAVDVPAWYEPNPGLAGDLAFVLFSGSGERTLANRITNGRWTLSAFGTASSASLTRGDTVYTASPVYHPSSLLTSVGGAIAGGSRLALGSRFEAATFWDEVRRYGATAVSYTWAMLDEIVAAPEQPGERHHPVRLFMGSGMPRGLWRRVTERFAPARVLEFYASTEGDAVLVNITGEKAGCKGRPLPGSAEVRVAAYDPVDRRGLILGDDGFAIESARFDVGMLLARVNPEAIGLGEGVLRGIFEPGDAWLETGDLFRVDGDGDFWLVDRLAGVIRTRSGVVWSGPIQDALGDLDAVALAVAYGIERADGSSIPTAAITLRADRSLDIHELERALSHLGDTGIPLVVRVVDRIPLTTWYRPITGPLAAAGIPDPADPPTAWYWDPRKGGYRRMSKAARDRLLR